MAIQLNHHIVWCRDKQRSARFMTEMLGLPAAKSFGPFLVVDTANGVSLDFHDAEPADVHPQHYAFLIGEDDFDAVFSRILARGLTYWADPFKRRPREVNHNDGGRGVYFEDPDRNLLEVLTRPYGSG
jgi:catechol 2,3-dioxygenase-like lactoylglutathione lyase family enzyme